MNIYVSYFQLVFPRFRPINIAEIIHVLFLPIPVFTGINLLFSYIILLST